MAQYPENCRSDILHDIIFLWQSKFNDTELIQRYLIATQIYGSLSALEST